MLWSFTLNNDNAYFMHCNEYVFSFRNKRWYSSFNTLLFHTLSTGFWAPKNQQFQVYKDDVDNLNKRVAYSIFFFWSVLCYMTRYVLIWFLSYDWWYDLYHALSLDVQWRFGHFLLRLMKSKYLLKYSFICFDVLWYKNHYLLIIRVAFIENIYR